MTKNQYRKAIAQLGLSQVQAARLLGVNPRTSRSWALGESPVPAIAVRFLNYILATKKTGETAIHIIERELQQ